MVVTARDIARTRGIANITFERMDAEEILFDADAFDAALCALGLMYAPDPEKAVVEMHRVSRPGGRATCAVWGQRSKCGWAEISPIVDARVRSEVCPMFFRLGTGDALERALASAGFRAITSRRLETRLHDPSAAEACEAAFVGGPVALAYSRFSESMNLSHARQTTLRIASTHAKAPWATRALAGIAAFLGALSNAAEQLTPTQRWYRILSHALRVTS
jgi:SAM-dependent methyltransferase